MEQSKDSIRLAADLQSDSIVDGPGLRAVLWTQGCLHHCPGCHNSQTWDFEGGADVPIKLVKDAIDELDGQDGFTFSGGDPMYQPDACLEIAKYVKNKGLNIWVYTGFTYEELLERSKEYHSIKEFFKYIDVLVDGRFILKEKDLNLLFRGSRNQRLIDMKKTLSNGEIVLFDENIYNEVGKFKKQELYV